MAGYTCEIYRSKDTSDGSTGEMCVAKGLGTAAMFGLTGSRGRPRLGVPPRPAPTRGPGKAGQEKSGPLDMDALMKQFGDAMKKQGEGK